MSPPRFVPTIPSRPPFVGDPSALVILDWSWWLHKAWALGGIEMRSLVVGWLCNDVLAREPAHLMIALDSGGVTDRHREQHPTDPEWRYKADRDAKPEEFYALSKSVTEIAELHSIPAIWAPGKEGDDVIATATRQARAAGYRVWICTADKDLHGLVEADPDPALGILVGTWDNSTGEIRGPEEVRRKYGVDPAQIADLLAIEGDTSDNIPGVRNVGREKASAILRTYRTLDAALSEPPLTIADLTVRDARIGVLAKEIAKLKKSGAEVGAKVAEREREMSIRSVERDREKLLAAADVARFSRRLTCLDCDAPIDMPWYDLPVGNFLVSDLQDAYRRIGFVKKERQVASYPKRQPWAVGGAW